jgi:hypothetical protein
MDDLRCPNLDASRSRLITAYQRIGDAEIAGAPVSDQIGGEFQISEMEQEIIFHGQKCSICRTIRWQKE